MDTRLKKFKIPYVLAYFGAAVSATYAAICVSLVVAMHYIKDCVGAQIWDGISEYEWFYVEGRWTGKLTSDFNTYMEDYGTGFIVSAVICLACLVIIALLSGEFTEKRGTEAGLNWFDRIWSELQLTVIVFTSIGIFGMAAVLYELVPSLNERFTWFVSAYPMEDFYGIPNNTALNGIVAGMLILSLLTAVFFGSVMKKLKYKMFLQKSLIGGMIIFFWKGVIIRMFNGVKNTFASSDNTTAKVVIYLIVLAGFEGFCGFMALADYNLDGFWIIIGIIFAMVWIFAIVPRQLEKFKELKMGAEEIKRGNLSYKIPVSIGKKGEMGELDRLAHAINQIGDAQHIAVTNELKNQKLKTELISNVSHDLKTPLTSMVSYIDLLKKEGLDSPSAPEYLEIIDSKTQRLKTLTENLFEAAKASSGAIPVNMTKLDLATLVTQSLAEMGDKLEKRNLQIVVENKCEEGCKVKADGQLLCRVIENLLGNVSKYAMEGSRVYIDLYSKEDTAVMDIKNISASQLNISADELMERFKRGDDSRNTEGSGLGLSIARDLTNLMKGKFEISIDGDLFKASVELKK